MNNRLIGKYYIEIFYAIFFLALLLPDISFSQSENFTTKTYTVDQGLPNNNVRSIVQDQYGFIWIATWDAVSRYDGYEFKNYYHDPQDSISAAWMDNHTFVIDKNNNIWINNSLGLWRYDRELDSFIPLKEFKGIRIHSITSDSYRNLWVMSDQGMFMYKDTSQFFEVNPIMLEGHKFDESFIIFSIDKNNNLWIDRNDTIHSFTLTKDNVNNDWLYKETNSYPINWRTSLSNFFLSFKVYSVRNVILLSSNLGLFYNDTILHQYRQISNINELDEFPTDLMGWNSPDRIFNLFNEGKSVFVYKPDNNGQVQTWLVDKNKNIWLGILKSNSEGNGLTKFIFPSHRFKHFLTEKETGERLGIISILKDAEGDTWIGSIDNTFLYHLQQGKKYEKCVFLDRKIMPETIHSRSLMEFNGKILAGNSKELLYCFDRISKKIKYLYPGSFQKLLPDYLRAFKLLIKDKYNNLLIAGAHGIILINPALDSILFTQQRIDNTDIFAVLNDCDSNYWFGKNGVLSYYDKTFEIQKHFIIAKRKYNVESVIEGDSNHLWLALLGGGICRFNKKTFESVIFSTQNGLKNSTCYNLLKDKHGHIWVSTNQGLSMFNPETKRFRNFGEAEGLQIVEFNADAVWHGADDEMMFGGMGGIVSFYPDSVENITNDYYAPLFITEMKVSGENRFPNVYEKKKVVLDKGEDNFQMTFACLDYMNADKLLYRYRLIENDSGWIQTDSRKRFANYINLKPGSYHFKVQVSDANGNWKKEAALEIKIPAFYYQTLLFKIASGLFIAGLITMIIVLYFRHYRIKERKEREILMQKEQVKREQLKLEALRGQLNPHFIFNSLNSVNDFILDNDPIKANQYLTDFASLMRAFLDNSKQEYIPLIKEIELQEHYLKLEQIRYSDRFKYLIDYEEVTNIYAEISPSMIQPFTENAVWHGIGKMKSNHKGEIRLIFMQENDDCIVCRIEDNGIGIKKADAMKSNQQKQRQSRGISIISERLAIINSTRKTNYSIIMEEIEAGTENPGTRVRIELPIKPIIPAVSGTT